jgi:hypothetical protein
VSLIKHLNCPVKISFTPDISRLYCRYWCISRSHWKLLSVPNGHHHHHHELLIWGLTAYPYMAQAVSRRPFIAEAEAPSHKIPYWLYDGQNNIVTGYSPSTSVFPCQYHSTIAPYSFIYLPPTLYNVFLRVLQFSPVSIIPPMLHIHSFIHHKRCIMLATNSVIK